MLYTPLQWLLSLCLVGRAEFSIWGHMGAAVDVGAKWWARLCVVKMEKSF